MKLVYKTDLVKAGIEALYEAKQYTAPENIDARASIAYSYAMLADSLDEDSVLVPDEWL